jgi:hypothetical protein
MYDILYDNSRLVKTKNAPSERVLAQKVFVIATLAIADGFLPAGRAGLLADPRLQGYLSSLSVANSQSCGKDP